MKKLDKIKQAGAEQALRNHVDSLQHKLKNIWANTMSNATYTRLEEAMTEAEFIVSEMREAFKELKKINKEHK